MNDGDISKLSFGYYYGSNGRFQKENKIADPSLLQLVDAYIKRK